MTTDLTASPVVLREALEQRYRIDRQIGRGAMAAVFAAHDLRHRRQVAIKVLSLADDGGVAVARFLREIDLTAKLHHPHILPVYDSGTAGSFLYYVMPHMGGGTLRDRLNEHGRLTVSSALRVLRDIVDALGYAHRRGIVHRDIKPENVMFSGRHAMVADFGIAKHMDNRGQRLSSTGNPLGTPGYMAPEQVQGTGAVDHRADIYAVGALAYELLTGEEVFPRSNTPDTLAAHLREAPTNIAERRGDIPRPLAKLVMKCLRKSPNRRFQSADKLLVAIERCLIREGRAAVVRRGEAARSPHGTARHAVSL
jgi:eukaryotic-like serine/threonine-protein kinase